MSNTLKNLVKCKNFQCVENTPTSKISIQLCWFVVDEVSDRMCTPTKPVFIISRSPDRHKDVGKSIDEELSPRSARYLETLALNAGVSESEKKPSSAEGRTANVASYDSDSTGRSDMSSAAARHEEKLLRISHNYEAGVYESDSTEESIPPDNEVAMARRVIEQQYKQLYAVPKPEPMPVLSVMRKRKARKASVSTK